MSTYPQHPLPLSQPLKRAQHRPVSQKNTKKSKIHLFSTKITQAPPQITRKWTISPTPIPQTATTLSVTTHLLAKTHPVFPPCYLYITYRFLKTCTLLHILIPSFISLFFISFNLSHFRATRVSPC
jgi:hypothetical protein